MSSKKKISPTPSPIAPSQPLHTFFSSQSNGQTVENTIEELITKHPIIIYQIDLSNCKSCQNFPPNPRAKVLREVLKLTAPQLEIGNLILENLPASLVELNLSNNVLSQIPNRLGQFCPNLKILNLSYNSLKQFPDVLSLSNLEILDISYNKISSISGEIIQLRRLRILKANNNILDSVPEEKMRVSTSISSGGSGTMNRFAERYQHSQNEEKMKQQNRSSEHLQMLEEYQKPKQSSTINSTGSTNRFSDYFQNEEQNRQRVSPTSNSSISNINRPVEGDDRYRNIPNLNALESIEEIDFSYNPHIRKVYFLDYSTGDSKRNQVIKVNLSHCRITSLPLEMSHEKYHLIFNGNPIYKLDDTSNTIRECVGLSLANCQIEKLEVKFFTQFTNLMELNLSNCVKKDFSIIIHKEIAKLKNLEKLWLNGNHLTALPNEICSLEKLNYLNVSNNELKELPPRIGRLKYLTELDASDNVLRSIPPSISKLPFLKRLSLENNKLSKIPYQFLNTERGEDEEDGNAESSIVLEYLNISLNNLKYLPYPMVKNFKGKLICKSYSFIENQQLPIIDEPSPLPDISNLRELLCKWVRKHKINMDADFYNHSDLNNELKQRIKDAQFCSCCGEFYLNKGCVLLQFDNDFIEGDFPVGIEFCSRDCAEKYAFNSKKQSKEQAPDQQVSAHQVEAFLKTQTKSVSAWEISMQLFGKPKWKSHITELLHSLEKNRVVTHETNEEGVIKWQMMQQAKPKPQQPPVEIPSPSSSFIPIVPPTKSAPQTLPQQPSVPIHLSSNDSLKKAILVYLLSRRSQSLLSSAGLISREVHAPIQKVEAILQELLSQKVAVHSKEKNDLGELEWTVLGKNAKDVLSELSNFPSGSWEQEPQKQPIPTQLPQQPTATATIQTPPHQQTQHAFVKQQPQPSLPSTVSPPQQFQQKASDVLRAGSDGYYCEVCKTLCTGPENFAAHINGKQHKKNVNRKALLEQQQQQQQQRTQEVIPPQQSYLPSQTIQQQQQQQSFESNTTPMYHAFGKEQNSVFNSSFVAQQAMYGPFTKTYSTPFAEPVTLHGMTKMTPTLHSGYEMPKYTSPPPHRTSPMSYSSTTSSSTPMSFHTSSTYSASPNPSVTGIYNNSNNNTSSVSATAVQNSPYYCSACEILCTGPEAFNEHMSGRKHKNRVDELALKARAVYQNPTYIDTSMLPFDPELAPQVVNIILKHKYGIEFEYVFGEDGPPHNRIFTAMVEISPLNLHNLVVNGKTKKEAKRNAAIVICQELNKRNELIPNVPKAFLKL